jgi:hypothetical protein
MTKARVREKAGVVDGVTDEDRRTWWEAWREYANDKRQPAIRRWAWQIAAPYINPKVAAVEVEKPGSKEFVVKVEDYRSKKAELSGAVLISNSLTNTLDDELDASLLGLDDDDVN